MTQNENEPWIDEDDFYEKMKGKKSKKKKKKGETKILNKWPRVIHTHCKTHVKRRQLICTKATGEQTNAKTKHSRFIQRYCHFPRVWNNAFYEKVYVSHLVFACWHLDMNSESFRWQVGVTFPVYSPRSSWCISSFLNLCLFRSRKRLFVRFALCFVLCLCV